MKRSILTEKIARRGLHLTREYSVSPIDIVRIGDIMDQKVPTILSTMTISDFMKYTSHSSHHLSNRHGIPIVNTEGGLVGIITRKDAIHALKDDPKGKRTVGEIGTKKLIVIYPDEVLREGVIKMMKYNIGRLLVVDRNDHNKLVGYIGRSGILSAWAQQYKEEHHREKTWHLKKMTSKLPKIKSAPSDITNTTQPGFSIAHS